MNQAAQMSLRAVFIGTLSGLLVFLALNALKAQQSVTTVRDVHSNAKQYVGTRVSVTGMAYSIRADTKWLNGQKVPCIKLDLYEVDPNTNGKGNYYIYVSLPTSAYKFVPNKGDLVSIEGTLKWPHQFAMIDE